MTLYRLKWYPLTMYRRDPHTVADTSQCRLPLSPCSLRMTCLCRSWLLISWAQNSDYFLFSLLSQAPFYVSETAHYRSPKSTNKLAILSASRL